jgi:NAD(P)-dependent dehydrogenase (short-subunit alcohol dehydrogenase family)
MDTSMNGKTVVFTGATRGMGRFAAIEFARRGANVLAVGRNPARGAATVEAIHALGGSAEFLCADMGEAIEVRGLAQALLARSETIDVLIHSAGGLAPAGARTREGSDQGFAQNFLGAYLLTRLLEERLLASAPARLIAVGSSTHRMVKDFNVNDCMRPSEDVSRSKSYSRGSYQMRSYQVAKLAVTAWIYSLARRWAGRGVTANLLDPGMVRSELGENFEGPALLGFMMSRLIPFFAADDPKPASEHYVRLATDADLANVSGMYFVGGKGHANGSSPVALDRSVQQRVVEAAEAWAAPFLAPYQVSEQEAVGTTRFS